MDSIQYMLSIKKLLIKKHSEKGTKYLLDRNNLKTKQPMKSIHAKSKLDELIMMRSSLKERTLHLSNLITEGIILTKELPDRWYIRNPNETVKKYLRREFEKNLSFADGCGYGILHGKIANVPPDMDYGWEITNNEFMVWYGLTIVWEKPLPDHVDKFIEDCVSSGKYVEHPSISVNQQIILKIEDIIYKKDDGKAKKAIAKLLKNNL